MYLPVRTLSKPLLSAALVTCLLAAAAARADGARPDCYVLAVGVDAYAHPKVHNLKGCVNDARTAAQQFRQQGNGRFGKVQVRLLTDAAASGAAISHELTRLRGSGQAGDFVVIFLSGHGGRQGPSGWYFLPHDHDPANPAATGVSDVRLLRAADALASQGKKVVVVIDACYAGRLRLSGRPHLDRYRDPKGGGIVLLLSSSPNQTSMALGRYSAFAQAVAEGLSGRADANRDGKVTLGEVQHYARYRVYEMLRQAGKNNRQDSEYAHSTSVGEGLVLGLARPPALGAAPASRAVAARKNAAPAGPRR